MDKTRYQLKVLNRQCSHLTANRTAQKNSLIAILDMAYPGANEMFASPAHRDGTQKCVDFVRTFWHVDCVRDASLAAFTEHYREWCRKNKYNFSSDKAAQIYVDAQEQIAVVPKDELTKTIIRQSVDALTAVSRSVERLRAELGDVTRFARRSTGLLLPALTPAQISPESTRPSVPASPNAARRSCAGRCSWSWTAF